MKREGAWSRPHGQATDSSRDVPVPVPAWAAGLPEEVSSFATATISGRGSS
jgi:hypothetical protein